MRIIMGHFRRRIDERELRFIWADLPAAINLFTEERRAELRKLRKVISLSRIRHKIYTREVFVNEFKFKVSLTKQQTIMIIIVAVDKQTLTCKRE